VYVVLMVRGWRVAGVKAALWALVAAVGLEAGFVRSASAFDGVIEERCSQVNAQYSPDRWQYGKFSVCASKSGSMIYYTVWITSLQYHWGGAWYNNKYKARVQTRLALLRDGRAVDTQMINRQAWTTGVTSQGTILASAPGLYTLVVQADALGLYWSNTPGSNVHSESLRLELVVA
jgi:hypothetical protein